MKLNIAHYMKVASKKMASAVTFAIYYSSFI